MGVYIVKRSIPWQSRAKKIIYPFFFYFKCLSIFRININAYLCEIYSKLSTSHQILKFNRILRIVEIQRFQFIISKHEEKEKREEKKKERKKGKNASRGKFFQMKSIISCNDILLPSNWTTDLYYWNCVTSRRGSKLNAIQPRDSRNFVQI